jgi:WhiB family transcriptional regulator, redox-sensing transcriptional regulator
LRFVAEGEGRVPDTGWLPGPVLEEWEWQFADAGRDADPTLFFPADGERGSRRAAREVTAKAICRRCPVRRECATHALATREPHGVWGGMFGVRL